MFFTVWFDIVPKSFPSWTFLSYFRPFFNIVQGFTTLNTVFSLGLCSSYNRHWARRGIKGGKEGENVYFSECNYSLFTLIPLHGLNTSSTAASPSLLSHLLTKTSSLWLPLFWQKYIYLIIILVVEYNIRTHAGRFHFTQRRLCRFGDAWIIWPWLVAMICGYVK